MGWRTRKARLISLSVALAALVVVLVALVPILRERHYLGELSEVDLRRRHEAVRWLGEHQVVAAIPHLAAMCREREEDLPVAVEALTAMGAPAVPALADLVRREKGAARWAAIAALDSLGPAAAPAVPALAGVLGDTSWAGQKEAAKALLAIGEPALPALLEALEIENTAIQEVAAGALYELGTNAIPGLVERLEHRASLVRYAAASALARFGSEAGSAVPALRSLLQDDDTRVRWVAAWALAQLGKAAHEALPDLVELLDDENWEVREGAIEALTAFGRAAEPEIVRALEERSGDADFQVAAIDLLSFNAPPSDDTVDLVVSRLNHASSEVQLAAIVALESMGDLPPRAVAALEATARSENADVSAAAQRAVRTARESAR